MILYLPLKFYYLPQCDQHYNTCSPAALWGQSRGPRQAQERVGSPWSIWPHKTGFRVWAAPMCFQRHCGEQDGPWRTWLSSDASLPSCSKYILKAYENAGMAMEPQHEQDRGAPVLTQLASSSEWEREVWRRQVTVRFNGRLKCRSNSKVVLSPIYFEYSYSRI